jgi:hypothetical protein
MQWVQQLNFRKKRRAIVMTCAYASVDLRNGGDVDLPGATEETEEKPPSVLIVGTDPNVGTVLALKITNLTRGAVKVVVVTAAESAIRKLDAGLISGIVVTDIRGCGGGDESEDRFLLIAKSGGLPVFGAAEKVLQRQRLTEAGFDVFLPTTAVSKLLGQMGYPVTVPANPF